MEGIVGNMRERVCIIIIGKFYGVCFFSAPSLYSLELGGLVERGNRHTVWLAISQLKQGVWNGESTGR